MDLDKLINKSKGKREILHEVAEEPVRKKRGRPPKKKPDEDLGNVQTQDIVITPKTLKTTATIVSQEEEPAAKLPADLDSVEGKVKGDALQGSSTENPPRSPNDQPLLSPGNGDPGTFGSSILDIYWKDSIIVGESPTAATAEIEPAFTNISARAARSRKREAKKHSEEILSVLDPDKLVPTAVTVETNAGVDAKKMVVKQHVQNWVRISSTSSHFGSEMNSVISQHYPSDHVMLLDDILVAFMLHRPEMLHFIMVPLIQRILQESSMTVPKLTDSPFHSFVNLFKNYPSHEESIAEATKSLYQQVCKDILRMFAEKNATLALSTWIACCLRDAPKEIVEYLVESLLKSRPKPPKKKTSIFSIASITGGEAEDVKEASQKHFWEISNSYAQLESIATVDAESGQCNVLSAVASYIFDKLCSNWDSDLWIKCREILKLHTVRLSSTHMLGLFRRLFELPIVSNDFRRHPFYVVETYLYATAPHEDAKERILGNAVTTIASCWASATDKSMGLWKSLLRDNLEEIFQPMSEMELYECANRKHRASEHVDGTNPNEQGMQTSLVPEMMLERYLDIRISSRRLRVILEALLQSPEDIAIGSIDIWKKTWTQADLGPRLPWSLICAVASTSLSYCSDLVKEHDPAMPVTSKVVDVVMQLALGLLEAQLRRLKDVSDVTQSRRRRDLLFSIFNSSDNLELLLPLWEQLARSADYEDIARDLCEVLDAIVTACTADSLHDVDSARQWTTTKVLAEFVSPAYRAEGASSISSQRVLDHVLQFMHDLLSSPLDAAGFVASVILKGSDCWSAIIRYGSPRTMHLVLRLMARGLPSSQSEKRPESSRHFRVMLDTLLDTLVRTEETDPVDTGSKAMELQDLCRQCSLNILQCYPELSKEAIQHLAQKLRHICEANSAEFVPSRQVIGATLLAIGLLGPSYGIDVIRTLLSAVASRSFSYRSAFSSDEAAFVALDVIVKLCRQGVENRELLGQYMRLVDSAVSTIGETPDFVRINLLHLVKEYIHEVEEEHCGDDTVRSLTREHVDSIRQQLQLIQEASTSKCWSAPALTILQSITSRSI